MSLILAFGSALLWGLFDAARKRLVSDLSPAVLLVHIGVIQALVFATPLLTGSSAGPDAGYWKPGLAVLALNTTANLAFVTALAIAPLNRTVPLLSLTPVFTATGAFLILGETLILQQMLGVALVVGGAFLLARGRAGAGDGEVDPTRVRRGVLLMLFVAFAWGSNAPFDKAAVAASSVAFHATAQGLGVALSFVLLLLFQGRVREIPVLRGRGRELLIAGLIGPAAVATQLSAFRLMDVAPVEVIKRVVGLLMAVALGRLLFAERLEPEARLGLLTMAIGLPLVLLA